MRTNHSPSIALLGSLIAICTYSPSRVAASTILDNSTPNGVIFGLGEPFASGDSADQYWAQTFTTPLGDSQIHSLDFAIENNTTSPGFLGEPDDGDVRFRVLLTTITTNGTGFHPDNILFESGVQVVPHTSPLSSFFQPIDIQFPNIPLAAGTQYAFVLDAFTDATFLDNNYPRGEMATDDGYNGGSFFGLHLPQGPNNVPTGTRADHFAMQWGSFPASQNVDMAFKMNFVPEPSSLLLAAFGGLALLAVGRWRRQ